MMKIFDSSRKYYSYRKNYYNWGYGPIYDEKANIIAKFHYWEKPARIEMFNLSDMMLLVIFRTKKSNTRFEIKDSEFLTQGIFKLKYSKLFMAN